jgi:Na+/H+-translocating membrane pyrophosphatase
LFSRDDFYISYRSTVLLQFGLLTLAGFYGVALAASAMMATTAMQLAIDALDQYLMQVVLQR